MSYDTCNCVAISCTLPFFQLIEGAIIVVPMMLMTFFSSFFITLVWFTPVTVYTFLTIWRTLRWGPQFKFVMTIVGIIGLILWPPLVLISAIIFGFFYGLFGTMIHGYNTCFEQRDLCYAYNCGHTSKVIKNTINWIIDFWHFNKNYGALFYNFRNVPNRSGTVFEVYLYYIPIGLIIAVIAGSINTVYFIILALSLCIPLTVRCFIVYYYNFCCCGERDGIAALFMMALACACILPIIGISFLILLVAPLLLVVCPFYGLWGGMMAAFWACQRGDMSLSYKYTKNFITITTHNMWAFIKGNRNYQSFDPFFDVDAVQPIPRDGQINIVVEQPNSSRNSYQNATPMVTVPEISMLEIWDNFFLMCTKYVREAINERLITEEEISEFAPFLFIGIPSFVVLRMINRSMGHDGNTFELADGTLVTEENRPKNFIADQIWPVFVDLKKNIMNTNLSPDEYIYLQNFVITCNEKPIEGIDIFPQRLKELNKLASEFQSVGTVISKMGPFPRRFGEAINEALVIVT